MTTVESHDERIPTWTFGDRLAKARREAGLEQNQIAAVFGVNRSTISHWETDRRLPKKGGQLQLAHRWAELTGCSLAWLLGVSSEKACLVALEYESEDPYQGRLSFEPPPTLAVVANNH